MNLLRLILGRLRSASHRLGSAGERAAVRHLKRNLYVILETNWHSKSGEIDIIARHFNTIVFLEVKTRSHYTVADYSPLEAVDSEKIKRIEQTAADYLAQNAQQLKRKRVRDIRLDIITVVCRESLGGLINRWSLQHFKSTRGELGQQQPQLLLQDFEGI